MYVSRMHRPAALVAVSNVAVLHRQYLRFNHSCVVHALKFLEKRTGQGFKENFLATQRIEYEQGARCARRPRLTSHFLFTVCSFSMLPR